MIIMKFNSFTYLLVFFPLLLVAVSFVFRFKNLRNLMLICGSVVFYSMRHIIYLVPLFISSIIDYVIGLLIYKTRSASKRKALLSISLAVNLLLLSFFKYSNFFINSWNFTILTLNLSWILPILNVTILHLPPGISFYTFQTMSYTLDIYKREEKPTKNFITYFTYVSFFPQLVAGPIERSRNLIPQLITPNKILTAENIKLSFSLIYWGLFKKIVLADNFAVIVSVCEFKENILFPGVGLIYAYAFGLQIYCDFSAYSDIARGTAKLFGVDLMRNFLTPYFAFNPSDFWRRWHISLSTWIRDYVYIPIGGNEKGNIRSLFNLLIVMSLCGLWHGASYLFVFWGIYHGCLLIIYRILPIEKVIDNICPPLINKFLKIFLFFNLVSFGWIMFRAPNILVFSKIVKNIYYFFRMRFFITSELIHIFWGFCIFFIPLFLTELIARKYRTEFPEILAKCGFLPQVLMYVVMYVLISILGKRAGYDFIYFQF